MPKYVCDTELVYSEGEKICTEANDLNTSISTYSTNVDSDLSGWTESTVGGKASFTSAKNQQVQAAQADCTYINEVGEFIKGAAKSIDELEDQLSALKI